MMMSPRTFVYSFFFFNDTATTEIYTLSLHDALPILELPWRRRQRRFEPLRQVGLEDVAGEDVLAHERDRLEVRRSEEHTSELQSQSNLVCRLLLEKKKTLTSPRSTKRIYQEKRLCSQ